MMAISEWRRKIPASYAVLGLLTLLALALGIYRLVVGLGATTNLSDHYPWGLWITLDTFLIPVAGAAFTVSAVSYFFSSKRFHAIVRPAVLLGFMGYVAVAALLLMDIGRWHQFYNILLPNLMNLHSFMEEIAIAVVLYTLLLIVEAAPMVLEKWNIELPLRWINGSIVLIAGAGIAISTMHQSSLGSMWLLASHKLHPLWWTPLLPALFLMQAFFIGLASGGMIAYLTWNMLKQPHDTKLMRRCGQFVAGMIVIYLLMKVGDWVLAGELGLLFTSGTYSLLIWAELILGLLMPLGILLSKAGKRPAGVFWAGVWILMGAFVNRLTVSWLGLARPAWGTYLPSAAEILIGVGVISAAALAYMLAARFFVLFPEDSH
jgi:Ni/Fe-hydrogenase subunit HybB-like protein